MVDDFASWCRFVSTIAQKEPGWHVAGDVSDGLEVVQKAEELKPDLIQRVLLFILSDCGPAKKR